MTRIQSLLLGAGRVRIYLQRIALRWLVALVGRWEWQAPAWLPWVGRQSALGWRRATATRARTATLAAAVLAITGASVWWFTRPTPHYVTYSVTPPGLTEYNDNGISSIKPLSIVFSESAAPLASDAEGRDDRHRRCLRPSPARGSGRATRNLQFTPKDDWPVDGAFTVRFAKKWLLRRRSRARRATDSSSGASRSRPRITESQFYQDPARSEPEEAGRDRCSSATRWIPEQLESRVSLAVAKDAEYLGLTPDSRHFTVAYDKFKLAAYIHSAALAMPRDDTPMTLRVDKGVRAARGGNDTRGPAARRSSRSPAAPACASPTRA